MSTSTSAAWLRFATGCSRSRSSRRSGQLAWGEARQDINGGYLSWRFSKGQTFRIIFFSKASGRFYTMALDK